MSQIKQPAVTSDEISRSVVQKGEDTVTYIAVTPPPPKIRKPVLPRAPQPSSAADLAEEERLAGKPHKLFSLSGTIYVGYPTTSELRWTYAGREWRAFSNVDFRVFDDISQFETQSAVYLWFSAKDISTETDPTKPQGFRFDTGRAHYFVLNSTEQDLNANLGAFDLLNYLHEQYDLRGPELLAAFQRRQLAEAAERSKPKPPKQKRTIIVRYNSPETASQTIEGGAK